MRLGMSGFIETRPTIANYALQGEAVPTNGGKLFPTLEKLHHPLNV